MKKINIFMDWIYYKPRKYDLFSYLKYLYRFKKFIRELKNQIAPDFIMLWHIVSFIRLLKITYFYRFNKDSRIFLIDDIHYDRPNKDIAGFILYENDYYIEIELDKSDKHVKIRILDSLQSKSKSELTKIEFYNGPLVIESDNIVDAVQYDYLNQIIMKRVSDILEYYFNKKEN